MPRLIKSTILAVLFLPMLFVGASGQIGIFDKFDAFGDIKCEDEYARLDNFAVQLQQEPQAKGVIIFYGGKMFRGRLPKRGEAEARAARLKPYLVQRRGIPANRITVINGGYSDEWRAALWIVPPGGGMPKPDPTVEQVKFRKGKANPRAYRCQI